MKKPPGTKRKSIRSIDDIFDDDWPEIELQLYIHDLDVKVKAKDFKRFRSLVKREFKKKWHGLKHYKDSWDTFMKRVVYAVVDRHPEFSG